MHQFEPFFGWLDFYSHESDPLSPFHEVEHNQFFFDRQVYDYLAHPLWDTIGSEGLLVKILFADYEEGYAVIELFGVWNDLLQNDWRLLVENCLEILRMEGIQRFVFIGENILNIYLDADDYYQAFQEELEEGWMAFIGIREHVIQELERYGIGQYFFWSPALTELRWRKLKPPQIVALVEESMRRILR
jgi:hypothetical protein